VSRGRPPTTSIASARGIWLTSEEGGRVFVLGESRPTEARELLILSWFSRGAIDSDLFRVSLDLRNMFDNPCGIADNNGAGRHVRGDHRARADESAGTDPDSG
jgi:hypothetical protein